MLVPQRGFIVRNGIAELGFIFAVEHQWDAEFRSHFRSKLFLAQNERLERMEQVFGGEPCQQAVRHAVGRTQVIVKARVNPCLKVLPPPGRIHMRRPGDGERVHAVLVFEHMRRVKTVFAARAGHKAVVASVCFAVTVAQLPQPALPVLPVDPAHLVAAGVAGVDRVLKLIAGIGLLVAHHTFPAELHMGRQTVSGLQLRLRQVRREFCIIDGNIAFIRFHTSFPLILIFLAVSGSKKGAARRVYHTLRAAPLLFTRIIIPQCPAAFKPAAHFIRIVHLPEKSI